MRSAFRRGHDPVVETLQDQDRAVNAIEVEDG